MENNITEIWKEITGYEGLYSISNTGKVKSHERVVRIGDNTRIVAEAIRRVDKSNGYSDVTLSKGRVNKKAGLHRLLAEAFIPNPENKPCVNHIDNNRDNNSIDNLEWVTHKENSNHYWKNFHTTSIPKDKVEQAYSLFIAGSDQRQVSEITGIKTRDIYDLLYYNRKCFGLDFSIFRKLTKRKYRGVSPKRNKWSARVTHNRKRYYLGDHETEDLAIERCEGFKFSLLLNGK